MLRHFVSKVCRYNGVGVRFLSSTADSSKSGFSSESEWSSDGEDNIKDAAEVSNRKANILKAALPFVPQYGWTKEAIALGAENVGMPGTVHGLFTRGPVELVEFFNTSANEQLTQFMSTEESVKKTTSVLLEDAITTRLKMLTPYIDHWPQAMALMAMPANFTVSFTNFSRMIDDIWYHAGDRTTYFDWYIKRGSLAAVYSSTEMYMLQDKSLDYRDTWNFLQRQMSTLSQLGNCLNKSQKLSNSAEDFVFAAMHVARNMLSVNVRHR